MMVVAAFFGTRVRSADGRVLVLQEETRKVSQAPCDQREGRFLSGRGLSSRTRLHACAHCRYIEHDTGGGSAPRMYNQRAIQGRMKAHT